MSGPYGVHTVKTKVNMVFADNAPTVETIRCRLTKDDKLVFIHTMSGQTPLEFADEEVALDLAAALNDAHCNK